MTTEPGKQEIIITRVFDAPRDLVFKAYTDPKHLIKWLGPRGFKIELKIFEPKADCGDIYIQIKMATNSASTELFMRLLLQKGYPNV